MSGNDQAMGRELPRYICHKEVHALKIASVDGLTIHPTDLGYLPFTVDQDYIDRHKPEQGGYYVVYADGYRSYSPAAAFEAGYIKRS